MAKRGSFVVAESSGTYAFTGPPHFDHYEGFNNNDEVQVQYVKMSKDKNRMIVGTNISTIVYDCPNGEQICIIPQPILLGEVSSKGSYLIQIDKSEQNTTHSKIWDIRNSEQIVFKRLNTTEPETVQFSQDESILACSNNNGLRFLKASDFFSAEIETPEDFRIESFTLSSVNPLYVLCFMKDPYIEGTSATAKIYKYPNFRACQRTPKKWFPRADHFESKWNSTGEAVLLITKVYLRDEWNIHTLNINRIYGTVEPEVQRSFVHAAEWSPHGTEFCAIFGKLANTCAAMFNMMCQWMFDISISPNNSILFNRHGNLMMLAELGVLQGAIEIWVVTAGSEMKILQMDAIETAQIYWLEDGVHFVTVTKDPQLNLCNGFKVWHYSGKLIRNVRATISGIFPLQLKPPPAFPEHELAIVIEQRETRPSPEAKNRNATALLPSLLKSNAAAAGPSSQSHRQQVQQEAAALSTQNENELELECIPKPEQPLRLFGLGNVTTGPLRGLKDICIDRFYGKDLRSKYFFLSHAHVDHMDGLFNRAFKNRLLEPGVQLYTHAVTPILMRHWYNLLGGADEIDRLVGLGKIVPVDVNRPFKLHATVKGIVCSVRVTFLPAGHCPGSVMFFFETPRKNILYTADIRLNLPDIKSMDHLHVRSGSSRTVKRIDLMYIDTTFCCETAEVFPGRILPLKHAFYRMKRYIFEYSPVVKVKLRFAAKFSHEFVLQEIYRKFNIKIHVNEERFDVYQHIPGLENCVTTDCDSPIHLCERENCDCDTEQKSKKFGFTSQWYMRDNSAWVAKNTISYQYRNGDRNVDWNVCYAMHSSLTEVAAMIDYFQPKILIPSAKPVGKQSFDFEEVRGILKEHSNFDFVCVDPTGKSARKRDATPTIDGSSAKKPKVTRALYNTVDLQTPGIFPDYDRICSITKMDKLKKELKSVLKTITAVETTATFVQTQFQVIIILVHRSLQLTSGKPNCICFGVKSAISSGLKNLQLGVHEQSDLVASLYWFLTQNECGLYESLGPVYFVLLPCLAAIKEYSLKLFFRNHIGELVQSMVSTSTPETKQKWIQRTMSFTLLKTLCLLRTADSKPYIESGEFLVAYFTQTGTTYPENGKPFQCFWYMFRKACISYYNPNEMSQDLRQLVFECNHAAFNALCTAVRMIDLEASGVNSYVLEVFDKDISNSPVDWSNLIDETEEYFSFDFTKIDRKPPVEDSDDSDIEPVSSSDLDDAVGGQSSAGSSSQIQIEATQHDFTSAATLSNLKYYERFYNSGNGNFALHFRDFPKFGSCNSIGEHRCMGSFVKTVQFIMRSTKERAKLFSSLTELLCHVNRNVKLFALAGIVRSEEVLRPVAAKHVISKLKLAANSRSETVREMIFLNLIEYILTKLLKYTEVSKPNPQPVGHVST